MIKVFLLLFVIYIYLALPGLEIVALGMFGLSCSMQTLSFSMWDIVPDQGLNLGPIYWECES